MRSNETAWRPFTCQIQEIRGSASKLKRRISLPMEVMRF
jgi:hypothetical protein